MISLKYHLGSDAASAAGGLELSITSRFYFDCSPQESSGAVPCGNVSLAPDGAGFVATPIGLPPVHLRAIGGALLSSDTPGTIRIRFDAASRSACLVATYGDKLGLRNNTAGPI